MRLNRNELINIKLIKMTKAEEIYEGFVEYERCDVSDRLKRSIIEAINKALTIPVVGCSLPSLDEMNFKVEELLKWYEDNRTTEQVSIDYRLGFEKGFRNCHKWIEEGN